MIVGVDEVGRGPWAGPVVAAAVALPTPIEGLADSKKLSRAKRQALALQIKKLGFARIAAASVAEIDQLNILHASMLAMRRAVLALPFLPQEVLVDGNRVPDLPFKSRAIVGGDDKVAEISAASIVAKVLRDELMSRLGKRYPSYGWSSNAGYGTKKHRDGIAEQGITPHHRRSFKPISLYIAA